MKLDDLIYKREKKMPIKINDFLAAKKIEREELDKLVKRAFKIIKSEIDEVSYEFDKTIALKWWQHPFVKNKTVKVKPSVRECCGAIFVEWGNSRDSFRLDYVTSENLQEKIDFFIDKIARQMDHSLTDKSCSC